MERTMHLHRPSSRVDFSDGLNSTDLMFVDMLRAFRRSGGLARKEEILQRLTASGGLLASDAREDTLLCFEWNSRLWMPRFQFSTDGLGVLPGPARVIEELSAVFDGWKTAVWFALPNLWLGGGRPVDLLDRAPCDVLGAARADRSIAAG
jgi:hypothetical protein